MEYDLSSSISIIPTPPFCLLSLLLILTEGMQQQQRRGGQEYTPSCSCLWSTLHSDSQSVVCMLIPSARKEGRWAHKMIHCKNRDTLGVFYTHQFIFFLSSPFHKQNNWDFPLFTHDLHCAADGVQQTNMCWHAKANIRLRATWFQKLRSGCEPCVSKQSVCWSNVWQQQSRLMKQAVSPARGLRG